MVTKKILTMLALISGVFLFMVIVLGVSSTVSMKIADKSLIPVSVLTQVMFALISGIVILCYRKRDRFAVKKSSGKLLLRGAAVAVVLGAVVQLGSGFVSGGSQGAVPAEGFSFIEIVVYVWLFASFSEELFFRGVIQGLLFPLNNMGLRIGSAKLSLPALLSGLFFGLMHFGLLSTGADMSYVATIVLGAVILGVTAGYFRDRAHSIWPAFIIHMVFNIMGTLWSIVF